MKQFFIVVRWTIGLFIILLGIVGLSEKDYSFAFFTLVIGILVIPHKQILNFLNKKRKFNYLDNVLTSSLIKTIIIEFPNFNNEYITNFLNSKKKLTNDKIIKLKKEFTKKIVKRLEVKDASLAKEKLELLYNTLFDSDIPENILQKANLNIVRELIIKSISDDDSLDPNEIKEIINLSKKLNVLEYENEENIRKELNYYITNWELDNGIFPDLQSNFILKKNEKCIYVNNDTEMLIRKEVSKRINYSGPRARIKIAKGLSYNIGSYNYKIEKEIKDITQGFGILNVTTKRILFKNRDKNVTIRLSSIINLELFSDAIMVMKETGKPIIFKVGDDKGLELYQMVNGAIRNL